MLRVHSFTMPVPGGGGGHPQQPGQSSMALARPQQRGAMGPLLGRVCGPKLVSIRAVPAHSSWAVPRGLKALAEGSAPQPPVSLSTLYPGTAKEGPARAVASCWVCRCVFTFPGQSSHPSATARPLPWPPQGILLPLYTLARAGVGKEGWQPGCGVDTLFYRPFYCFPVHLMTLAVDLVR